MYKSHVYFQDGSDTIASELPKTPIQSGDLLTVQVSSKTSNQDQAAVFNIPNTAAGAKGYLVDTQGNIDLPLVGKVKAAGLSQDELERSLTSQLTNFVRNPFVVVRFARFQVNVLGEVSKPGTQKFEADRVTLIDALGAAGDLTDNGRRDNITVVRSNGQEQVYHRVDLRSRNLTQSPAYLLRPNDIVYVTPDEFKLKRLAVDPEKQRRTGVLFSVVSIVIGLSTLLVTFIN